MDNKKRKESEKEIEKEENETKNKKKNKCNETICKSKKNKIKKIDNIRIRINNVNARSVYITENGSLEPACQPDPLYLPLQNNNKQTHHLHRRS